MSRNPRRSLVCSSVALALCLAPSLPVLAATVAPDGGADAPAGDDPEALSAEAVERFQAKEYDAAVDLFEQAYAIDPQPNYLFNIGRVYEEKGDLENAIVYYQRFVGQSGVDLESRQSATERLKVLREAVAQMKAEEKAADEVEDDDEAKDIVDQPPEEVPADDADDKAAARKKALRITGYSLLGVGGSLAIVGAVFGGLASGSADDADADPFIDRKIALRDRARTQARTADALFITGGVVATAGLVLVLSTLARKKSNDGEALSRRTMWAPVVSPTRVGLGLTHRF